MRKRRRSHERHIGQRVRFGSKLSCLINVARANNWRGCGGGRSSTTHHESISASLSDLPPPIVSLLFLPDLVSFRFTRLARVISAHKAFDLRFRRDGTIKKYRDDGDAASVAGPSFVL